MFENDFSMLDRYGENFTETPFITNPAIGRDKQIGELILILLTPEKSAILIGKPGIGKTAIVEGLAYRIQKDDVPDALKGYTIINVKTASLLGTLPSGESKVQKLIDELKEREKVILFVDEVHMLIGATDSSSLDFANIFKEGLGRGSIKVIGATTSDEYERYILRDKAFTRRFQKVEVPEPTQEETVKILMGTLPKIEKGTGVKMKYTPFIQSEIMKFIVEITDDYKRVYAIGSRYPDIALTLLKQAFSHTVFDNRKEVDIFDVKDAIIQTKNVYPDVIKKELPRFDKVFKDIIKEEQGEETGLEWKMPKTEEYRPPMAVEAGEETLPFVGIEDKEQETNIPNRIVEEEVKLRKTPMPNFRKEADTVLLSGQMNAITSEGIMHAKHDDKPNFPKLEENKKLPKLEKGLDILNFERNLPKVSILEEGPPPLNQKQELVTTKKALDSGIKIAGLSDMEKKVIVDVTDGEEKKIVGVNDNEEKVIVGVTEEKDREIAGVSDKPAKSPDLILKEKSEDKFFDDFYDK